MTQDQLEALRILRDALDTNPGERDDYLSMRCGADTHLRERVDALLRGIADDDLASPNGTLQGSVLPHDAESEDPLVGTLLGPFRVVERIGRGGMGIVYRGQREGADFSQQVAIKLIRRGFDFDDIRARFLRERRILARLSHPNLARFIDGGIANDGRPWFALEFIDGQSITKWCDAHRLDIRARVRLFLEVCSAVQYAHTQLIVHRDLKPANVLVDEVNQVRLLDFGVAGLLVAETGADEPTTIGVRQALTPEYAAPEQFTSEPVGVATDVYSLGVILFELVGGSLPYAIDRHDLANAERVVREATPLGLATAIGRVRAATTTGHDVAQKAIDARLAHRNETLGGYRRRVRGDLTRIVEKALAKEPIRRYATAQAFADDLARWLHGIPVHATGNRLGYRLRKFIGRNRVALALATVASVVLVLGIAGMVWQTRTATISASRAEAMQSFVFGLFRSASPLATADHMPATEDLLAEGAAHAQSGEVVDAQTRFDMLMTIGRIYLDLRRFSEAMPLLEQTLDLGEQLYGPNDTRLLPPLFGLLQAETYQLEINDGKPQQAIAHLSRARAIAATRGTDSAKRADVLLAECALRQADARDMGGGIESCRAAVHALEQLPRPDAGQLAKAYYLSARVQDLAGDHTDEAIATAKRGLQRIGEMQGDTARYDEMSLSAQLSETLASVQRFDEALAQVRHANALAVKIFPHPHPDRAKLLFDEASLLRQLGREEDAEKLLRQALDVYTKIYGEHVTLKSADMYWTRLNLVTSLVGQKKFAEADTLVKGMIADVEGDPDFRKHRKTVAQLHANLAMSLVGQHRLDEAEPLLAPILEMFPLGPDGIHRGSVPSRAYQLQGRILLERGHALESVEWFENAIAALGSDPSKRPTVATGQIWQAKALRAAGRVDEAIAVGTMARDARLELLGESHRGTIEAHFELAQSLQPKAPSEASDELRRATESARVWMRVDDPLRIAIEGTADK